MTDAPPPKRPPRPVVIEIDDDALRVTPRGRFFLRNICMPFDAYLGQPSERPQYSRTV